MQPQVPVVPAGAPVEEIVGSLDAFGAVIVTDLLDPDSRRRFNAELDPLIERQTTRRPFMSESVAKFYGRHTRHLTALATHSPTFVHDVLCNPTLLGVCDAVLGPSCARYQLNLAHIFDRGPGAKQQFIHRDDVVWVHMPAPHPELEVSSVIALVDFTASNGATRVVPGSHRWPRDRRPTAEEIAVAEMPAGSAVLYLGSTLHAGGANTTSAEWRRGMHLSYVVGWLRTEENHFLATPPEVARRLPRKAQELLGYAAHNAEAFGGGYLGSLDLQDPIDLLQEGAL